MDIVRINQILMRMGGSCCNQSHLLNKNFCSLSEIDELIQAEILIRQCINGTIRLIKTKKAKEIW